MSWPILHRGLWFAQLSTKEQGLNSVFFFFFGGGGGELVCFIGGGGCRAPVALHSDIKEGEGVGGEGGSA